MRTPCNFRSSVIVQRCGWGLLLLSFMWTGVLPATRFVAVLPIDCCAGCPQEGEPCEEAPDEVEAGLIARERLSDQRPCGAGTSGFHEPRCDSAADRARWLLTSLPAHRSHRLITGLLAPLLL